MKAQVWIACVLKTRKVLHEIKSLIERDKLQEQRVMLAAFEKLLTR